MTFLAECSPVTAFLYFLAVTLIPMMTKNPVVAAIALTGAFVCSFLPKSGITKRLFYLSIFIVLSLLNPIFSHNGKTVLFLIEDTPITLESLIYGAVSAASLISILIFFSMFSKIMKSDRLLYLFGLLSPKLALVLSTAIRFIPLFTRRARDIEDTGRVLGLYRDDSFIAAIKGKLHVFSVMTTWMLEDGIKTADSMAARGYGTAKRTFYSPFKFTRRDAAFIAAVMILTLPAAALYFCGTLDYDFYPEFTPPDSGSPAVLAAAYIAFAALTLLPVITDIYEELKWKYLMSKI